MYQETGRKKTPDISYSQGNAGNKMYEVTLPNGEQVWRTSQRIISICKIFAQGYQGEPIPLDAFVTGEENYSRKTLVKQIGDVRNLVLPRYGYQVNTIRIVDPESQRHSVAYQMVDSQSKKKRNKPPELDRKARAEVMPLAGATFSDNTLRIYGFPIYFGSDMQAAVVEDLIEASAVGATSKRLAEVAKVEWKRQSRKKAGDKKQTTANMLRRNINSTVQRQLSRVFGPTAFSDFSLIAHVSDDSPNRARAYITQETIVDAGNRMRGMKRVFTLEDKRGSNVALEVPWEPLSECVPMLLNSLQSGKRRISEEELAVRVFGNKDNVSIESVREYLRVTLREQFEAIGLSITNVIETSGSRPPFFYSVEGALPRNIKMRNAKGEEVTLIVPGEDISDCILLILKASKRGESISGNDLSFRVFGEVSEQTTAEIQKYILTTVMPAMESIGLELSYTRNARENGDIFFYEVNSPGPRSKEKQALDSVRDFTDEEKNLLRQLTLNDLSLIASIIPALPDQVGYQKLSFSYIDTDSGETKTGYLSPRTIRAPIFIHHAGSSKLSVFPDISKGITMGMTKKALEYSVSVSQVLNKRRRENNEPEITNCWQLFKLVRDMVRKRAAK